MVARISTGKSLYGALAYNEKKVQQGEATSMGAINCLADASRQGLYEKAKTLQSLADRNERTTRNTYHVALSFAQDDRMTMEQLRSVARDYMDGIGFAGQPAYLYRHHDTANDHIHIVTTNIKPDGKRIADSFLGATKSQETRRAIEETYNLVRAEDQQVQQRAAQGIGKDALKHHARHSINRVLKDHKPSSIGELNALLRAAEVSVRESRGSTAYGKEWRGYTVDRIDARSGEDASASIKASKIFETGWSAKLDQAFQANAEGKDLQLKKIRKEIQAVFSDATLKPAELHERLKEGRVGVIEHRNEQGYLYGLHYVNERTGHVFKASEVGKKFTAAAWRDREQMNHLSDNVRQELDGELKKYMNTRGDQLGFLRSAAIKQVTLRGLQDHVVQKGYQLQDVTSYLKAFQEAEKKEYPKVLKRDQATMDTIQRGIERLRPEHRRAVLEATGMVITATGSQHRHNEDIKLKPTQGVSAAEAGMGTRMSPLTWQEKKLLTYVGRIDGVGGLPQTVHVGNVDWAYWKEKLPQGRGGVLEERLHKNYVQAELQSATRRNHPTGYLISRGVVVEPNSQGYTAYHHHAPHYRVELKSDVGARIAYSGYTAEDFNRIKQRLEESVVKQLYQRAEAIENTGLRNISAGNLTNRVSNRKSELPSYRIRTQVSGFMQSAAPQLYQQGLYELLRNTDQEEDPEVRRLQRHQQRLSD